MRDFALERYFARWEFAARHLLCTSDIEGWPMADLLALADDEMRARWEGLRLGYTEAAGDPLLRAEIASLYEGVEPDDILTFAGAEEAIFIVEQVLLGPGTHAIVTWPSYQALHEVARSTGAEVTLIELRESEGWRLDLDAVRAALRPETRLIVVNEPHNPTGSLDERATFDGLVALAAEADAHLVVDEVYRDLELDPADRLPAAVEALPKGVSIGVMSKAYGLAGLRVGWIATRDPELRARAAAFKDYTTICNSAPSEVLALIALRAREQVLARSRAIIAPNLALLDDFFARWEGTFEWVRPRAGSIGFPRLMGPVAIEDFAAALVEEEGVLILPGTLFDHEGNNFRVGFGRTTMPESLERFERFAERRLRSGR